MGTLRRAVRTSSRAEATAFTTEFSYTFQSSTIVDRRLFNSIIQPPPIHTKLNKNFGIYGYCCRCKSNGPTFMVSFMVLGHHELENHHNFLHFF